MRKLLLLLVVLLLAAAFAVADDDATDANGDTDADDSDEGDDTDEGDDGIDVEDDDTETGDNLVEEEKKPPKPKKAIARLHLVGAGIAISEDDVFDFMHAKAVIGAVKVRATADDNVDSDFVAKRLGVLMLDEKRYHLKDIAVSLDEISAEIYGPTTTATAVSDAIGEIKVKRFEKPGKDIWAGNMVLNDKAYNVYFLGIKRNFRLAEITAKIGEYCEENPEDAKCKNVVAQCAGDKEQCGERIREHCQNNTTDMKCLQLKKLYCLKNATDERCREYLETLCEKYPRLKHCRITSVNGEEVIGINTGEVAPVTAEAGETTKNLIASKVREKLKNVARPVSSAGDR